MHLAKYLLAIFIFSQQYVYAAEKNPLFQQQTLRVHNIRQRTIYKSCDGRVISDQVESLVTPDSEIEIKPSRWLGIRRYIFAAQNHTTCSTFVATEDQIAALTSESHGSSEAANGVISRFGNVRGLLLVNPLPVTSQLRIADGENTITYQFLRCTETADNPEICVKAQIMEEGTLFLNVHYSESEIPGVREIIDCTTYKTSQAN